MIEFAVALPGLPQPFVISKEECFAAVTQYEENLCRRADSAIAAVMAKTPKNVLTSLYTDAPRALRERREMAATFARRLRTRWRAGLNTLEMLIIIAQEAGEMVLNEPARVPPLGEQIDDQEENLMKALVKLHVKACRIACEVVCLLSNGFADGANARWRSLHELAVISLYLCQAKGDAAERYLNHAAIERLRAAEQYQKHCTALGQAPMDNGEYLRMTSQADLLTKKYGVDYKNDYFWASASIGKRSPKFAEIEKALDMDKWRPYYKMACHSVHAGSQRLFIHRGY